MNTRIESKLLLLLVLSLPLRGQLDLPTSAAVSGHCGRPWSSGVVEGADTHTDDDVRKTTTTTTTTREELKWMERTNSKRRSSVLEAQATTLIKHANDTSSGRICCTYIHTYIRTYMLPGVGRSCGRYSLECLAVCGWMGGWMSGTTQFFLLLFSPLFFRVASSGSRRRHPGVAIHR